jgi:hypothetical protein
MTYTKEMRDQISQEAKGKKVESLMWEPEEGYWVMTFEDGSEISFRFMAELI